MRREGEVEEGGVEEGRTRRGWRKDGGEYTYVLGSIPIFWDGKYIS